MTDRLTDEKLTELEALEKAAKGQIPGMRK